MHHGALEVPKATIWHCVR